MTVRNVRFRYAFLESHVRHRSRRSISIAAHPPLSPLPLVTLYVTERCNSRCITCDYWRHGRNDMDLAAVTRLLPSFAQLRTQSVLLSGGEPLLNPEWAAIAQLLRSNGLNVWLLTSGLALAKHARRAAELFDAITVSLDGTDPETYAAIRGLDAFHKVCEGIRAAAGLGLPPEYPSHLAARQLPATAGVRRSGEELGRSAGFLSRGRRCQSARIRPYR